MLSYSFLDKSYPIVFSGSAPDLGAFEYKAPTGIPNHYQYTNSDLKITDSRVSDISTISFTLEKSERISLNIYDISGKCIQNCVQNQIFPAGYNYHVVYLGNLPKGNYIVQLQTENQQQSLKFIH